ncbi:MAG: DeoR family transcriptional regulator [Shewanella sp.]|nr:DeoR family transcriptional regulator [Shewanella sp.]MCF1432128.1 DeoR family transcriptional regulator [Shewanella sp.]MCF1439439.1 DeoR family transcriptional regulator [Shewanella sp.]MCF1456163.1 DeoR family transcriptional regulator [Shewanella sp.]
MTKRNTQQRRHTILNLLNEQSEVSVDELVAKFKTSAVTIRKDLTALEKNGLLFRRHGGAIQVPQDISQGGYPNQSPNKQSIAAAAARLISDHNRIIIDSGSTTIGLIPHLNEKCGLLVMTNSLNLANAIQDLENEPTLLMTGGTWDPHSESFQGKVAEQVLRSYNFDQLFIGADGLDLQRGTTTFNELTSLSQVMADVSREVIVMLESHKLGRIIPNLELPWSKVNMLVTDDRLPAEAAATIRTQGIEVIVAPYAD